MRRLRFYRPCREIFYPRNEPNRELVIIMRDGLEANLKGIKAIKIALACLGTDFERRIKLACFIICLHCQPPRGNAFIDVSRLTNFFHSRFAQATRDK